MVSNQLKLTARNGNTSRLEQVDVEALPKDLYLKGGQASV